MLERLIYGFYRFVNLHLCFHYVVMQIIFVPLNEFLKLTLCYIHGFCRVVKYGRCLHWQCTFNIKIFFYKKVPQKISQGFFLTINMYRLSVF